MTFYNQPIYDDQGRRISYLFAVQVMDTTGTVSLDLQYGSNVRNVYISEDLAPVLTVYEVNYLGLRQAAGLAATVDEEVLEDGRLIVTRRAFRRRYHEGPLVYYFSTNQAKINLQAAAIREFLHLERRACSVDRQPTAVPF